MRFLLHSYSDHRVLHSFPTRRSSDLGWGRWPARARAWWAWVAPENRRSVREARNRGQAIDRKSTRLNSSHITISYAVFCLKKKNFRHLRLLSLAPRHLDHLHEHFSIC